MVIFQRMTPPDGRRRGCRVAVAGVLGSEYYLADERGGFQSGPGGARSSPSSVF